MQFNMHQFNLNFSSKVALQSKVVSEIYSCRQFAWDIFRGALSGCHPYRNTSVRVVVGKCQRGTISIQNQKYYDPVQKQKDGDRRLYLLNLSTLSLFLRNRSGCDPGFYDRFLG
jgi:hypothetical protein